MQKQTPYSISLNSKAWQPEATKWYHYTHSSMVKILKTENTKCPEKHVEIRISDNANWCPHFGRPIKSIHKVEHTPTPWPRCWCFYECWSNVYRSMTPIYVLRSLSLTETHWEELGSGRINPADPFLSLSAGSFCL